MSEPYQAFLLVPRGIAPSDAVQLVHNLLTNLGANIDEDSLLILNDFDEHEPEPEYVRSVAEALGRLAAWPTMGSIDYMYCEAMTTISFKRQGDHVAAIAVSILSSAFERGENYRECFLELVRVLDDLLRPIRTIMQWGLEMSGFSWEDEMDRLKRGQFASSYPLLDIRRKSVPDE